MLSPAVPVNTDSQGHVETDKLGLRHYAVRGKSQDSDYKPRAMDIAPRSGNWRANPSNTQTEHQDK